MAGSTHCTVALCQATAKPLDVAYNLSKITEGMRKVAGAASSSSQSMLLLLVLILHVI